MNYQLLLDRKTEDIKKLDKKPTLLLHCCCAPCSSYVLEYLSEFFEITAYFYNPNIFPKEEYEYRKAELIRLIEKLPEAKSTKILSEEYDEAPFLELAKGKEDLPEGRARCYLCYKLRLFECAKKAREKGYNFFCTTLSISPHKNAEWLNELGKEASEKYGVEYLFSDFKKRNGYKRSIELSKKYSLYRQAFCGCKFSKLQYEKRENKVKA